MRSWLLVVLVACGGGNKPPVKEPPPKVVTKPADPVTTKPADPTPAKPTDPMKVDCKDVPCLITQMETFSKKMCDCRDKACADKVNDDFTQWGTELAKRPELADVKPSDDDTRRVADVVTKYSECMQKLLMAGEKSNTGLGGGAP